MPVRGPVFVVLVAALSLVGVGACTQPQPIAVDGAVPRPDAPSIDAPAPDLDGGEPRDAPLADVPSIDAPLGCDAGAPDTGTDAPPSDAGVDALRSCDAIFGGMPQYLLCAETATTCEFFSRTSGSCNDACRRIGSTCLESYSDGDPARCTRVEMQTCAMVSLDRICICTR